jgi:hypothetical protein
MMTGIGSARYDAGVRRVAQFYPGQAYHHQLAAQTIEFLQTRDPAIFPFVARFDEARMAAFVRELREALADLTDSGSARKTSAAGFMTRDRRLQEVVSEWAFADGGWPPDRDPGLPLEATGSRHSA